MKEYFCKRSVVGAAEKRAVPWLPETYDLDDPTDCVALLEADEKSASAEGTSTLWIYKPASNNRSLPPSSRLQTRPCDEIHYSH